MHVRLALLLPFVLWVLLLLVLVHDVLFVPLWLFNVGFALLVLLLLCVLFLRHGAHMMHLTFVRLPLPLHMLAHGVARMRRGGAQPVRVRLPTRRAISTPAPRCAAE